MFAKEYHSSTRKQHVLPSATTMTDPGGVVASEITHADRDRHAKTSLIREIWKSQTKKKQNGREL